MVGIPEITIRGNAAYRGNAYGKGAAQQIASALKTYRGYFAARGVEWPDALETAAEFRKCIEDYAPESALEIEAIALGSGQTPEAIVLLNARTEILFWRASVQQRTSEKAGLVADECTGIIVTPNASDTGTLLHAQNWDWMPGAADHTVVLRVLDHDGPNALHFVEAGQLARHGLNELGLAVSAMGLHSDRDYGRLGVPSPILRQQMINSGSLGEALGMAYGSEPSFSHALAVSHAEGEAVILESAPGVTEWLMPEAGSLTHANHCKSDVARLRLRDVNLARCPDSLTRDQRVRHILASAPGKIDSARLEAALLDTAHRPGSVLRAPSARPGGLMSATLYTLIMEPAKQRARVALRPYEGAVFVEYTITE